MPEPAPLRCRNCGSNKFIVPDHATNDSLVRCARCGDTGIGTWGEVRIGLLEEANEQKAARRAKAPTKQPEVGKTKMNWKTKLVRRTTREPIKE